jgi:hypothetical protein
MIERRRNIEQRSEQAGKNQAQRVGCREVSQNCFQDAFRRKPEIYPVLISWILPLTIISASILAAVPRALCFPSRGRPFPSAPAAPPRRVVHRPAVTISYFRAKTSCACWKLSMTVP